MKYKITFIPIPGEEGRISTRIFGQYEVAEAAKIAFENAKTGYYSDIIIKRVKNKKEENNNGRPINKQTKSS